MISIATSHATAIGIESEIAIARTGTETGAVSVAAMTIIGMSSTGPIATGGKIDTEIVLIGTDTIENVIIAAVVNGIAVEAEAVIAGEKAVRDHVSVSAMGLVLGKEVLTPRVGNEVGESCRLRLNKSSKI